MRIRTSIAAAAAGLCLVAGLAVPAGAAPPSVGTPYPQAGLANYGACGGMAAGAWKSPAGAGIGVTRNLGAVSLAMKGVPATADQAANGQVGACLLSSSLGVTSNVPSVLKFAMKLTSEKYDCKFQDSAAGEQPLQGKATWSFDTNDDGTTDARLMGYLRVVGLDSSSKDILWVTGLVTKGDAAGATIGGNFWYTPIVRTTLATKTYDVPNRWQDNTPAGVDTYLSWAPGYAFSGKSANYFGNCGQYGTPASGAQNVTDWGIGMLSTSGYGFGHASAGFVFLL